MAETAENKDFDIRVDDQALQEKLKALGERTGKLKPALETIGEILVTSIQRNFEAGGRYSKPKSWRGGNTRWRPLSAVTLFGREGSGARRRDRKKANFRLDGKLTRRGTKRLDKKILVTQGLLVGSIDWRAGNEDLRVGTNLAYAAIHNFGGKAGRGKKVVIPPRPFMVVQDEDLEEINDALEDHLTGRL